ncbi:LOW QUALITY PROTEIN: hypothetical protein Ct61P_15115 [Colletotrichum tofieldiae]|nr:LOW QUALITY PROTEIN: hypothetical protein Ct61P_15115 [Colletotrichum tofieldiae]
MLDSKTSYVLLHIPRKGKGSSTLPKLDGRPQVFAPVHHDGIGVHWTLARLAMNRSLNPLVEISFFDSVLNPDRIQRVESAFKDILSRVAPGWQTTFSPMECARQHDEMSCSVFMLVFLGHLLSEELAPLRIHPYSERRHLAALLPTEVSTDSPRKRKKSSSPSSKDRAARFNESQRRFLGFIQSSTTSDVVKAKAITVLPALEERLREAKLVVAKANTVAKAALRDLVDKQQDR